MANLLASKWHGPRAMILAPWLFRISQNGGTTVYGNGFAWRLPNELQAILSMPQQVERWRIHECMLNDGDNGFGDCVDHDRRPLIFLWGDSTSGALVPGLRDLQGRHSFGLAQFAISSCEPVFTDVVSERCRTLNREVMETIDRVAPDVVLLEAIWYPTDPHLDGLAATVVELKHHGVQRVVVLGRVPVWEGGLKYQIFDFYRRHRALPSRLPQPIGEKAFDIKMRARLEPLGAVFVSAWDAMCDPAQGCIASLPGAGGHTDPSATDVVHLSEAGSAYLINSIAGQLLPP